MTDYKKFVLTARKGKGKSEDAKKRSKFLSLVMPHLSSDNGKSLAEAIANKDLEKFKSIWQNTTNKIIAKLEEEFKDAKPKDSNAEPKKETVPEG